MSTHENLKAGKALLVANSDVWRELDVQVLGAGTVYYGDDQSELENLGPNGQRGLGLTQASTQPPKRIGYIGPVFMFSANDTPIEVFAPQFRLNAASSGAAKGKGGTLNISGVAAFLALAGRFALRMFLMLSLFAVLAGTAKAQDQHVYFVGNSENVFTGRLSTSFQSATGLTFIFSVQSNQSVQFFITNNTSTSFNLTEAVHSTGNPLLSDYTNNKASWGAVQTIQNGLQITSAPQVLTMAANATEIVGVPMVQSAQLALTLSSATVVNLSMTLNVVVTSNGGFPLSAIQGLIPSGAPYTSVNPVVVCFKDTSNNCSVPTVGGGNNGLDLSVGALVNSDDTIKTQNTGPLGSAGTLLMVAPQFWNPGSVTSGFERMFSTNVFASASATASGNTAVWVPANRFVLECISVDVTGDATQTVAGDLSITLQDGTTTIPGFLWKVFVPSTAITSLGELYSSGTACFKNGYMSSTAGNTLNVNLSAALSTGSVVVRAWGANFFH